MKTFWDFFQNQVLGMKWLNEVDKKSRRFFNFTGKEIF